MTSHAIGDSVTMLRRTLLHIVRYPGLSMFTILGPVVVLLLTVFVFGGTLGAGLPGADVGAGRDAYLAYVMPGILLITIAGTAGGTAITVATDMAEGITARFRTMSISRASVLAGHVLGNTIQAIIAVALVLGVGVLIGFRPTSTLIELLGAIGLIALISFAVSWVGVAMGMQSKTVETASNLPLVLTILPLLGSGFVPTGSLPSWMRWFAQHQPFTPFTESVRALLLGTPLDGHLVLTACWAIAFSIVGFVWSIAIYERKSVR